jgi:alginate O-acetyltransferase complex protein AlgI
MLFSDPEFLFLFLPIVLAVHTVLPRGGRNAFLLLASLAFYAAGEGVYVGVLICIILFNHAVALAIERSESPRRRKALLWVAVGANLFTLIRFKYADFLLANLAALASVAGQTLPRTHTHLPIGISFFTFQAISYVVDVYRRQIPAVKSVVSFGMYKSLFPQLIAGPIVRAKTIYSELEGRRVALDDFAYGARRFIYGLAKKLLVADVVAQVADAAFNAPSEHLTTGLAWMGLICYAIQIYFDFSGYSDMAIGMGRMLGFHFHENFRYPYISRSVGEFWRRWHISLSSWFRDYLYIPLGGNRVPKRRVYVNLIIVFLLCGLWHGASWTFVVWGAWHGIFLIIERAGAGRRMTSWPAAARRIYLLAVVLAGWVFFRAADLRAALGFFHALSGGGAPEMPVTVHFGIDVWLAMLFGVMFSLPVARWAQAWWWRMVRRSLARSGGVGNLSYLAGRLAGAGVMSVNLVLSFMQVSAGTHNPFIYFRF